MTAPLPKRGRRYDSRRYSHERTSEPMPAYVVGEYVVEKARRDWTWPRAGFNATSREWWEVRRQHSRAWPGCTVGPLLHEANTLTECLRWIGDRA